MSKATLLSVVILLVCGSFYSEPELRRKPAFLNTETPWADSTLQNLTTEEKVGQLFMVAAYSNRDSAHVEELKTLIKEHHVGGFIFFQGTPHKQKQITEALQFVSRTPLFIGQDAEWGLSMRLDSTMRFPRAMTLAAIDRDSLVFEAGKAVGEQLKQLGVHVNFAPVADVNNNPRNPVINSRSFGEDKLRVARLSAAYSRGLSAAGIIPVAKHFPGHGDTHTDSHKDLPELPFDLNRLKNTELYPFQTLIDSGIPALMSAHLHIPALDDTPNMPATLSRSIITGLLRDQMKFEGLIFTDALNMKGITKHYEAGEADLKAFLAGNDILLFPEDVPKAARLITQKVQSNDSLKNELNQKVHRILKAREAAGAHLPMDFGSRGLSQKLHTPEHDLLNRELFKRAQTLVHNKNNLLPLKNLESKKVANVYFGSDQKNTFQKSLQLYERVKTVHSPKKPTSFERKLIRAEIDDANLIIASLHQTKLTPAGNFGITKESLDFIEELSTEKEVILVLFGNPYALSQMSDIKKTAAVLVSYEEAEYAQHYAAEVIFGASSSKGILPVSIDDLHTEGSGIETQSTGRLSFSNPLAVGLDPEYFKTVDNLVNNGITEQAYPGAQVLIAKSGKVIYHKAFGNHRYEKGAREVQINDIYDIASVTKIAATTASLMILNAEGKISLDQNLGELLPEFTEHTEYADIKLKDLLTHHAGLVSWIPFYKKTMSGGVPRFDVYSMAQSELYPHRVAENFYIHKNYPDSILRRIVETPRKNKNKDYVYSDLGYFFTQRIIEKISGQTLDKFATENIYKPLGMGYTRYKPNGIFDLENIVPTEYDVHFRKQLIHGDVHDPAAAMMGGVAGHAGVFSNAADLAKLMQTLISSGNYGDAHVFSPDMINKYTDCLYCENPDVENRRGIGFDKPVRDSDGGPTCNCISYSSFGHTGFTGTMMWADPEEEVILIFLSNRIYPSAANRKLISMGVRTDIMQTIYDAIDAAKTGLTPIEGDIIPKH